MGRFGLRIKFSSQNGPPPEVVLFDGWSGLTEKSRSISKKFCFQSYLAKQQSKISVETQMDRFDAIENVVSIEQCRSILS